jgi:hypothetical protein
MVNEIPLKTIKRILKNHYNGEITKDACIYVRNYVVNIVNYFAEEAKTEFKEYNRLREIHNLPVLKRLDKQIFVTISDKIFKPVKNNKIGKVGQYNEILFCQGDNIINKTRKDVIIKDAGNEVA